MVHTGKSGDWDKTVQIFDALQDSKLKPDVWTYTSLINACQSCGNDWQSGIEVFEDMEFQGKSISVSSFWGFFGLLIVMLLSLCFICEEETHLVLLSMAMLCQTHNCMPARLLRCKERLLLIRIIETQRHCSVLVRFHKSWSLSCKPNAGCTKLTPAHV